VLFAQQWASLDQLSNGRAWLAVCLGGPDEQSKAQALEHSVMNVSSGERVGAGFVEGWTVAGGPKQCIEQLRAYLDAGLGHMALRLTSWDQRGQLQRFLTDVAPAFA
jgi:alkanesulfonate monooxygenase SsuD/methylene tetrahydromethanopterin reductase-like flavin-dependent oxidoreductase (luciferase family)